MLIYHRTSILTSQAQTVVNTVNTVGVMGKGLASAFKKRYPDMFKMYRELCQEKRFDIGRLWLWKASDQWVLNFPTKKHWRNPSRLSYIEDGLKKFVEQYEQRGIREIAFPRLGCGNGGLEWDDVRPLMEGYLSPLPILVYVHDFEVDIGSPEHQVQRKGQDYKRSFEMFLRDLGSVLHKERGMFVTLEKKTPYRASLDEARNLHIARSSKRNTIPSEELFEMWTLLLRGPLTKQRLPGTAREEAYYIFPILAGLPYVRPIQIGRKDDTRAIAVELMDQKSSAQIIVDDISQPDQGELEWA